MLLPARTAVLNQMYDRKKYNVQEVMAQLKSQYGEEKQFNQRLFSEHLMALEANGLVELDSYNLDGNDELLMYYIITEEGRKTVDKYVNKAYR
ncbi:MULTISPECIES: hypothetical protein [Enterococcaceae]|uniref:hypothetical protein n=1 Tax=Enterococcaceae TaxID=81852 RepID=UPI000E551A94|nr:MULTISPECIES: hypothetical protein [Enterococcaceae]MCI0130365.1 hypothetical protein [Vagococcus sp. CY53-2]RGI32096.1 hypothetical protein DXC12_01995 [Melissococcus sp. OM08-11BH]UNM89801.1 hypothetical protein MN187_01535 [Vagococcus sp. CY52-2]